MPSLALLSKNVHITHVYINMLISNKICNNKIGKQINIKKNVKVLVTSCETFNINLYLYFCYDKRCCHTNKLKTLRVYISIVY